MIRSFLTLLVLVTLTCSQSVAQQWEQAGGPIGISFTTIQGIGERGIIGYGPAGVYRNVDGISEWSRVDLPAAVVNAFERDSSGIVFAATDSGLYRSSDDGITWAFTAFADTSVRQLAITRTHLFVIVEPKYEQILLRSSDGGETWIGLPGPEGAWFPMERISAQDAFVVVGLNPIYQSRDTGVTWSECYGFPIPAEGADDYWLTICELLPDYGTLASWYDSVLLDSACTVIANNGPILSLESLSSTTLLVGPDGYMGNTSASGVWRSTDGGRQFEKLALEGHIIRQIVSSRNRTLYARTESRVFRSTDRGDTWTILSSIQLVHVRRLVTAAGDRLFAATSIGNLVTTDRGDSWEPVSDDVGRLTPTGGGALLYWREEPYGDSVRGSIVESTDGGLSWTELTPPKVAKYSLAPGYVTAIPPAILFADGGCQDMGIACLEGSISRSADGARTWTRVFGDYATMISYAWTPGGLLYSGAGSDCTNCPWPVSGLSWGVFRSSDLGVTWRQIDSSLNLMWVTRIIPVGDTAGFAATSYGVYAFSNSGASWRKLDSGIAADAIKDLVRNEQGTLFAATAASGVFRSTDNGLSWSAFNEGLWFPRVSTLALDERGYLYAGTAGASLFRTAQTTLGVRDDVAERSASITLAPNPTSSISKISIHLVAPAQSRVFVVDILGRELINVFDGVLPTGISTHDFSTAGLSRGTHLVIARIGHRTLSAPIIVAGGN